MQLIPVRWTYLDFADAQGDRYSRRCWPGQEHLNPCVSEPAWVPQSRSAACCPYATQSEDTEGITDTLSTGVTGEDSPQSTNQPQKTGTDRVLVKFFLLTADVWTAKRIGACEALAPVAVPTESEF
jgi:hypothetical protein